MSSDQSAEHDDYRALVQVPITTFRDFVAFIMENELWDDATTLLKAHGLESVAMGRAHIDLICSFVETKSREFEQDPSRSNVVTPRCSIVKRPPKTPKSPGPKTAPQ